MECIETIYRAHKKIDGMNNGKTFVFAMAILLAGVFIGGFAYADADDSASLASAGKTIKSYGNGTITQDALRTALELKYSSGTLTKSGLKTTLSASYRHNILQKEDLRFILGKMYADGKLTRDDLRWILTQAYANKELTRDDLRYIISYAYKNNQLTREDVRFLIVQAYKAGELKRDDVRWILSHAYKAGQLTRADLRWLIVNSYREGILTRDDVRELVAAAYVHGELTRADVKWLLVNAYNESILTRDDLREIITVAYNRGELTRADLKWLIINSYDEGILTKEDVRELLKAAYRLGELRASDVKWILNQGYVSGEISQSDVSTAEVTGVALENEPAVVPSMPDETADEVSAAADSATTDDTSSTKALEKDELKTTQAWMLYKYALLPAEKHRLGMDALIGYVESIGADTTKLAELKSRFVSEQDSLRAAAEQADYSGAKSVVGQMRQTVDSFRAEVLLQVGNNTAAAKNALEDVLEANEDYLDSLVTEAREARRDRNLEAFDFANAKIDARLDKAVRTGADVSALKEKLDEIKDKRSELLEIMNKGIESCKGEGIGRCNTSDSREYVALRAELLNDYKDLANLARQIGQKQKVENAITKAREIIANAKSVLANAEAKGRDVAAIRAKLSEVEVMVDSAEAKYNSGDYGGATEGLKSAQTAFSALKNGASQGGVKGASRR